MTPVNSLWFKWKSLRLPWRRSFLVGSDLSGNTYWEFKDALKAGRFRRIVKYSPKTHYADVQVTPQWHQWLRYVRKEPPSIAEQQQDVLRQIQMKQLARLADERWASKPSYLDKPQTQPPAPATSADPALKQPASATTTQDTSSPEPEKQTPKEKPAKDPWAKAQGPSEGWQPEAWSPSSTQR